MRWHALIFIFIFNFLYAADFSFPTGLTNQDLPKITEAFTLGFLTRTPISLLAQDEHKTLVSLQVNTINTKKIAKLGNKSKDEVVKIQEFSFLKKLPLNVELGIQSSLSLFDQDINTYGGYVRWLIQPYSWGGFSFLGHGASANYQNLVATNLYGGLINFETNAQSFYLSVGAGVLRSTNTFDASLFVLTLPAESVTYGKSYSHYNAKLSYLWENLAISVQGDWLKEVFSSVNISYLF